MHYCSLAAHLHHQGLKIERLSPLWISRHVPRYLYWHLYCSGSSSNVSKSLVIKGGHKHLIVSHEYFRSLNIIQKWPLENKAPLRQITSTAGATRGSLFWFLWLFCGMIGLICHLQQKELGHWAVDNPIYRFAIYYKFLWLLGPLSHRFLDCLLSWVLMSCCLNHCIITALIHFLAYPYTRSVGSPLLQKNGLKHFSLSRQLVTSSLKQGVILLVLAFNQWQSSCSFAECFGFRWWWALYQVICSRLICEWNVHEQPSVGECRDISNKSYNLYSHTTRIVSLSRFCL